MHSYWNVPYFPGSLGLLFRKALYRYDMRKLSDVISNMIGCKKLT